MAKAEPTITTENSERCAEVFSKIEKLLTEWSELTEGSAFACLFTKSGANIRIDSD